jgi:hypothetical protein
MRTYENAGVAVADVLLPKAGTDLAKWAVVACDQYTSEPEYWDRVRQTVGEAPSTLRLIYPEVYLGEPNPEARIESIRSAMRQTLDSGLLVSHEGLVYVEREVAGKTRRGVVLALDLDRYDYSKGSQSLVRATEGTIVERIPPRVKIRQGAPLELPHIMVLIDDPADSAIGPLREARARLKTLYDFELMEGAGHLRGMLVEDRALEKRVIDALGALGEPAAFRRRYGFTDDRPVLLYAMGDGNHSLATAKAIWESAKQAAKEPATLRELPIRHALIELVNVHDEALVFEPIHRVLFEVASGRDPLTELAKRYSDRFAIEKVDSLGAMKERVAARAAGEHHIGVVRPQGYAVATVRKPETNLAVGTLQSVLDPFMAAKGAKQIDYVHGTEPVDTLGRKPGNVGFMLPAMDKHDLFKSVALDGPLPRKTFSMGEAYEKRFYMECRRIG